MPPAWLAGCSRLTPVNGPFPETLPESGVCVPSLSSWGCGSRDGPRDGGAVACPASMQESRAGGAVPARPCCRGASPLLLLQLITVLISPGGLLAELCPTSLRFRSHGGRTHLTFRCAWLGCSFRAPGPRWMCVSPFNFRGDGGPLGPLTPSADTWRRQGARRPQPGRSVFPIMSWARQQL